MDGNTTQSDTGWFFGSTIFPEEFQRAVAKNKTGEVFFVDVSHKQWHYIVKKTYNDELKKGLLCCIRMRDRIKYLIHREYSMDEEHCG